MNIQKYMMAAGILLSFVFSSFAGSPTSWVSEYSFSVDGLYYNILNNREVEVTYMRRSNDSYCPYKDYNFDRDLQVCNIPESVTYNNNTYSVVRIGYAAFCEYFALTSVTIPNSVTTIEQGAFAACRELTSITMSSSVVNISQNLFYLPTCYGGDFPECTNLTDIYVPCGELERFRQMIPSNYRSCVKYVPTSITVTLLAENGMAENLNEECDSTALLSATPNTGYHFIQWSDGDLNNPRTVQLTQDTFFTAEFAKNTYTITATSNNTVYGIATGGATVEYLDELTLTAVPQTGHHFEYWKSGSTMYSTNPLTITVSDNANYTAYFAPNVYSLTTISDLSQGYVTAPSQAEFLEEVIMTATPNYGYEFVQWGDGVKDNPRYVQLTQDTTFTAEFAKNTYTISTISANPEWGTTAGDKSALYLDVVEISATPNYGYHFVKWNDNNTSNPRMVSVTEDKTYTATFAKNIYSITKNAEHGSIDGNSSAEYLDFVTLTVTADYGYHFTQWSDGNKENPRTFVLTQDTTFTAEFAKNTYTITTESSNPKWGTTAGDNSALYLDEVEISATANYGYHFVKWNDNNTSNPRTISVTEDKTYTATFAKNVYPITTNAEHGSISGDTSAEYLDEVTLTANPDYGYHFTQWSDGNKDNPRTIELTRDTTFTAEFAIDKTGNCGDDNALIWTYDAETKTLTITGNGTLNSNYYFGIEAPVQMQKLVIGNEITSIGDSAFYGMSTINHLIIGGSVATIGNYAFAECRNFDDITCYATTVPVINETTFANVGNKQYIYLFVPEERERAYHRDTYWGEFDIQIKEAETTTTDGDVVVVPTDNTAEISWPTVADADIYEIEITKDGVVVCVLKFNTNGQLVGIAFAPGRNGANYTQQAQTTGFKFTVTGLTSGTRYGYTVAAKDALEQTVDAKSGTFTTTIEGVTTDIDQVIVPNSDQITNDPLQTTTKLLRNGQIFILRGDHSYTTDGRLVR